MKFNVIYFLCRVDNSRIINKMKLWRAMVDCVLKGHGIKERKLSSICIDKELSESRCLYDESCRC